MSQKIKTLLLLFVILFVCALVLEWVREVESLKSAVVEVTEVTSPKKSVNVVPDDPCTPYKFTDLPDTHTVSTANSVTTYTHPGYGFQISYPSSFQATSTFIESYMLSSNWRSGAQSCVNYDIHSWYTSGKNIVSFRVRNEKFTGEDNGAYTFTSDMRIGASDESREVRDCLVSSPTEQMTGTVNLNGINFSTFKGGERALIHRVHHVSYRTLHNKMCYAIELVSTWQAYEQEAWLAEDIKKFDEIVKSFRFIVL